MPFVRGYNKHVFCPLTGNIVPIERCYECRYYIKRDMAFVFCEKEIEDLFGRFKILKTNPFMVLTEDGKVWKFKPENDYNTSAVFVEVKTGEVKKIQGAYRPKNA